MELFDLSHGSCESCMTFFDEGDIYFKVDQKQYCQKCLHRAEEDIMQIPYLISHKKHYRMLDERNIRLLDNGIYAVNKIGEHLVIYEILDPTPDKKDVHIQQYLDMGMGILEKRLFGSLFLLPKELRIHALEFDANARPYEEIGGLLKTEHHPGVSYLLESETLTAVTNMRRAQLHHRDFFCYRQEWKQAGASYFEELRKNPPIPIKVSAALQRITPADMLAYFESRLIGQKTETKKIVFLFYEFFRCAAQGEDFTAPNWILTAPSGCGKTEVYRILRDFCRENDIPIPVVQVDLSLITEAGYKGKETTEIIRQIVEANHKTDGTAICFLDEADKKFVPSISGSGNDGNAAVQANLLTLVEGSMQSAEIDSDTYTIDTGKTMFVFMGAFQSVRDKKQKKQEARATIGFGASVESKSHTDCAADCFYEDITLNEMLETGMLEELAGRVEQVINLHKLTKTDMLHLLEEKIKHISNEMGITIRLTGGAKNDLLEICYGNLGIRRPLNCIRSLVRNTLADRYFDADFDKSQNCVTILSREKAVIKPIRKQMVFEESA